MNIYKTQTKLEDQNDTLSGTEITHPIGSRTVYELYSNKNKLMIVFRFLPLS